MATGAAGGFSRMPDGVCGTTGLVSAGGRDKASAGIAGAGGATTGVGCGTRGGATGLGTGLYRDVGFSGASVG